MMDTRMTDALLRALRETTHAISTNELAEMLGHDFNTLTNTLLNALARKGLVKNIAKPKTLGWWIAVRGDLRRQSPRAKARAERRAELAAREQTAREQAALDCRVARETTKGNPT